MAINKQIILKRVKYYFFFNTHVPFRPFFVPLVFKWTTCFPTIIENKTSKASSSPTRRNYGTFAAVSPLVPHGKLTMPFKKFSVLYGGIGTNSKDRRHAWMFRVAYHTLLNIKRSNNIPTVPLSQSLINESMGGEVSIDDFDLSFSQMLSSLSRNDQIIIIAVWKGFSFAEIASMLGISTPAARKRHYRALKKLKKLYEQ